MTAPVVRRARRLSSTALRFPQARAAWIGAALSEHGLGGVPIVRAHHHLNHAASAYFGLGVDPGEPYLILTLDGGGDGDCAHVYRAQNGELELLASTPDGHSLGNVYARVTHMLGMVPHEHEYKLMGLAPYADPERAAPLVDVLRGYLDLDPANPLRFRRRIPEPTPLVQWRLERDLRHVRFDVVAAAIQAFTEDLLVRWVREAVRATGIRKVLAAGGVFMNVKANKLIAELEDVELFDVFPSCGDESLPFGAVWLRAGRAERFGPLTLGPDARFDLDEARRRYTNEVEFHDVDDPELEAAQLLAAGEIVARCSGRMEFGARALGNRSLLADPAKPDVVPEINGMIKQRDFWMPFAPAVLAEAAQEYVQLPSTLPSRGSPWMMHTFDTTARREEFLAAVHPADHTARAQTVQADYDSAFHRLISEFATLSGKAIVLNTSFNLHGSPIVLGACDAIDVMLRSSIEHLFVGETLVTKLAR